MFGRSLAVFEAVEIVDLDQAIPCPHSGGFVLQISEGDNLQTKGPSGSGDEIAHATLDHKEQHRAL